MFTKTHNVKPCMYTALAPNTAWCVLAVGLISDSAESLRQEGTTG